MFIAELMCTDEDCTVVIELVAESLEELDALVCEGCECTLQTLSISEVQLVGLGRPIKLRGPRAAAGGMRDGVAFQPMLQPTEPRCRTRPPALTNA